MMENTILIQVTNKKALGLLKELEQLNLIKFVKSDLKHKKIKLTDKYRGVLSKKLGIELNEHIEKIRGEWKNI